MDIFLNIMDIKEIFEFAAKTGKFPHVIIESPIKYHPNLIGKVTKITENCVAVDFGGHWHVWFNCEDGIDKRKHYMYELKMGE